MSVMPGLVRGPLAGAVMGRLSEWLAAECYANSTVAQILGVARGLSVWMDDHDVTRAALTVGVLDAFEADYGLGVAGHVIVGMRLPAIRRFLTEAGFLTGAVIPRKRVRRPVGKVNRPVYHHKKESIDAHLAVVFAALAVSHHIEQATGWTIKKFVRTFRQYRDVTLTLAGQTITASQPIPADHTDTLAKINNSDTH